MRKQILVCQTLRQMLQQIYLLITDCAIRYTWNKTMKSTQEKRVSEKIME